jgi:putative ABC transport system ATP-binding protein
MSAKRTPAYPAATPNGSGFIQLQNVVKTFHTTAGDYTALKDINLHVGRSEFVSVVGKSGSGKSTLMNMITGIDHPSSGSIRVENTILNQLNEGKFSQWRGRNLGIVFQFFQLLPTLSLLENVMLPMDFSDRYPLAERETRALELLRRVGLEEVVHKLPAAVSGGQQQSAAVARALANDPPIIMADEPTGNLDSVTAERIIEMFEELVAQGKTILMVTHDPVLAERTNRILVISDGEIVQEPVVQALSGVQHSAMLQASKQGRHTAHPPGQPIPLDGWNGQRLHIITGGRLDVIDSRKRSRSLIAQLHTGQMLDEADFGPRPAKFSLEAGAEETLALLTLEAEMISALKLRERRPPEPEEEASMQDQPRRHKQVKNKKGRDK